MIDKKASISSASLALRPRSINDGQFYMTLCTLRVPRRRGIKEVEEGKQGIRRLENWMSTSVTA
ncbi:hypothetical protein ER57_18010 [Smithella sp. SCADC]|jgi:hypothetical protein|nr:hypothetical protein ER57_18010 [Smithella sp. SCADC]HAR49445.1 hypothetical protein [Smithella sp.]